MLVAQLHTGSSINRNRRSRQAQSTRNPSLRRITARTRFTTTSSTGTSIRPITSRSTTTLKTNSTCERVASYAESAYQHVSSDLRHDLAQQVPLIIFKTHSEFEQQNVSPGAAQEGVLAFAEGERNRMVLPIDLPSDLLYGLIVHELTHVFQVPHHPDIAHPPRTSRSG